jgi:hypothetical protein
MLLAFNLSVETVGVSKLPTLIVEAVTLLKVTLGPSVKEAPTMLLAVSVAGTVKLPFVSSQ